MNFQNTKTTVVANITARELASKNDRLDATEYVFSALSGCFVLATFGHGFHVLVDFFGFGEVEIDK